MRLGLHANTNRGTRELLDYVRRVQPSMVKFLELAPDVIQEVKRLSPRTIIVYREYCGDQDIGKYGAWIGHMKQRAPQLRNAGVDVVEGWNEMTARDNPSIGRFAQYEATFAKAMNDLGLGAAIGGFSTGFLDVTDDPARSMYNACRPIFELCHERGGDNPRVLWHSHEYSAPYMQYMVRTPDGLNQWPFKGASPGEAFYDPKLDGWLTLRYRQLWKRLVEDGYIGVRMILTETGVDDVNPRPGGANRKGWRDYDGTEWSRLPGIGDYASQQRWYGWQLSHDHYVLGWCDFGFATGDPAWNSFDLLQTPTMRERMIVEMLTLPEGRYEEAPVTTYCEGVDVSHHQGRIDWAKMKAKGVAFAWVKVSEGGNFADARWQENAQGANDRGILVGPYHYWRNGVPVQAQLDWFASIVERFPWTLPVALDFEDVVGVIDQRAVQAFVEGVAARLGTPVIYTGRWWWNGYLRAPGAWAGRYPLWISDVAGSVEVPKPWTKWTIHQHRITADGREYGCESERLDHDRTLLTRAQLAALKQTALDLDLASLRQAAVAEQAERGIHLYPEAALLKRIRAAGMVPIHDEANFGERFVYQTGEAWDMSAKRIYVYDKTTGTITEYEA